MSLPTNPLNRKEAYLNAIATGNTADMPAKPITREEAYLDAIAKNGGGSGGAENYAQLSGKPQINNVELASGNNSLSALGIASESAVNGIKDGQSINSFSAVETALGNKVDKVEGKGLSTNDYSDTEKGKVADNTSAIEAIVNENGCCNIAVHNCKSTTIGGATFTVNADSSITATAPITGAWQGVASTALFKLKGGITYKLTSGLPATSGFFMQLRDENGVDLANTYQVTEATYTPLTDMNCKVAFLIHDGYSMTSDETLYPMIYDARLNPTGYVKPVMTNEQLTERVINEIMCSSSIEKFGGFLNSAGGYTDLWSYYVAGIPVSENSHIEVLNPANNANVYSAFYDNSNQLISGSLIQHPTSGTITATVPLGARVMRVTMYNNSGAPRLRIS